jgi:hypothetical protein
MALFRCSFVSKGSENGLRPDALLSVREKTVPFFLPAGRNRDFHGREL